MDGILDRQFAIKLDVLSRKKICALLFLSSSAYALILCLAALWGPYVLNIRPYFINGCSKSNKEFIDPSDPLSPSPDKTSCTTSIGLGYPVWAVAVNFNDFSDHFFSLVARVVIKGGNLPTPPPPSPRQLSPSSYAEERPPAPFHSPRLLPDANATVEGPDLFASGHSSLTSRWKSLLPRLRAGSLTRNQDCDQYGLNCIQMTYRVEMYEMRSKKRLLQEWGDGGGATEGGDGGGWEEEEKGKILSAWTHAYEIDEIPQNKKEKKLDVACELGYPGCPTCRLCSPVMLLQKRIHTQKGTRYLLVLTFINSSPTPLNEVYIDFIFKNLTFAAFECICKVLFVFVNGIVLVAFVLQMRELPCSYYNIEQWWIMALLVLLIGFNDPFFVLVFVSGSGVAPLLGILCKVTFYCALFLYWIVVLEGIASEGKERGPAFTKLVFAVNAWVALSVYFIRVDSLFQKNPLYFVSDMADVWQVQLWLAISGVVYCCWLLYLLCRALREIRMLQFRFKLLYGVTLVIIIATFLGLSSGSAGPVPPSAVKFVSFQCAMNLYLYLTSFFYMPAFDQKGVSSDDLELEAQEIMNSLYGDEFEAEAAEEDHKIKEAWKHIKESKGESSDDDEEH